MGGRGEGRKEVLGEGCPSPAGPGLPRTWAVLEAWGQGGVPFGWGAKGGVLLLTRECSVCCVQPGELAPSCVGNVDGGAGRARSD